MSEGPEKPIEETLKKYLGISAPRLVIAILMIIFGILIIAYPDILAYLVAIYLLIGGVLALVDEIVKSTKIK